jgi:hypothetical protein
LGGVVAVVVVVVVGAPAVVDEIFCVRCCDAGVMVDSLSVGSVVFSVILASFAGVRELPRPSVVVVEVVRVLVFELSF